jgi:antitoxin HicB
MTRVLSPEIQAYLDLPYAIELVFDRAEDGAEGWVAEVEELPGCISQGATPEDAVSRIRDAMEGWISVALEDGIEVPRPRALGRYSGKFVVRVPQTLHADLVRSAEREGVSLNQFVSTTLARSLGRNER